MIISFLILFKKIFENWFSCLFVLILITLFNSSSSLIFLFVILFSFNLRIKKPPGIVIGSVWSLILISEIFFKISLFIEFSLIQPILPPDVEVSDILYIKAEFSKPFSLIPFLIMSNFSVKVWFFGKSKKSLMLHAFEIKFLINKKKINFTAKIPKYFLDFLNSKKINLPGYLKSYI